MMNKTTGNRSRWIRKRVHFALTTIVLSCALFNISLKRHLGYLFRRETPDSSPFSPNKETPQPKRRKRREEETSTTKKNETIPPNGYPWHRWSESSMDPTSIIDMLETNIDCSSKLDADPFPRECRGQRHLVHYIIRNGTIMTTRMQGEKTNSRKHSFEEMLKLALDIGKSQSHLDGRIERVASGDFPIFLRTDDVGECFPSKPILTFSTFNDLENCRDSWPIPCPVLWDHTSEKATDWDFKFEQWNKAYPWNEKKPVAVWRGGSTGSLPKKAPWQNLPRVQLVQHGMDHPDLIDAALVKVSSTMKHREKELLSNMRFDKRIQMEDFMKSLAVIDIDGNSWSGRFGPLLCYNSVVIKIHPTNVDYFYKELEPWKHYVPVNANMSNLVETVEYVVAKENREKMKGIVKNANKWCKQKLTKSQLATDMLWTLVGYTELIQDGDPDWPQTWKRSNTTYDLPFSSIT